MIWDRAVGLFKREFYRASLGYKQMWPTADGNAHSIRKLGPGWFITEDALYVDRRVSYLFYDLARAEDVFQAVFS